VPHPFRQQADGSEAADAASVEKAGDPPGRSVGDVEKKRSIAPISLQEPL